MENIALESTKASAYIIYLNRGCIAVIATSIGDALNTAEEKGYTGRTITGVRQIGDKLITKQKHLDDATWL